MLRREEELGRISSLYEVVSSGTSLLEKNVADLMFRACHPASIYSLLTYVRKANAISVALHLLLLLLLQRHREILLLTFGSNTLDSSFQ